MVDSGVIYAGSVDGKVYALKTENGDKIAEFDLGSPVISSPVLVDGAIIVASEEGKLYSLDITSNQESRTANQRQLANVEEKIHAPLAAGNGVVYIHSDDDILYAVDTKSGVTLWSLPLKSE
ncbi:Outer membrane protein assembly factor BamB [subsurface metagenome]